MARLQWTIRSVPTGSCYATGSRYFWIPDRTLTDEEELEHILRIFDETIQLLTPALRDTVETAYLEHRGKSYRPMVTMTLEV